jgi:hypothetical protein
MATAGRSPFPRTIILDRLTRWPPLVLHSDLETESEHDRLRPQLRKSLAVHEKGYHVDVGRVHIVLSDEQGDTNRRLSNTA